MARSLSGTKAKVAKRQTLNPPAGKAKSKLGPVCADAIELVKTPGSRERGGGPGGEAWIILANGKRAGAAYINIVDDPIRGLHASFHVFLNRPSQGRQIGRIAYLRCCALSQHDVIYAHMRKSNTSSRKAAEHAGFVDATGPDDSQLVLVWHRPAADRNEEAVVGSDDGGLTVRNETPSQCHDVGRQLVGQSTDQAGGIVENPMSSIELDFDEKNEDVLVWGGQVVMSRTEEEYFRALFFRLAYLNPATVLEIGFGLGISASLIQEHMKPTRHDIVEIEKAVYQDLERFAEANPSVYPRCGDWKQLTIDQRYDFIFFDPFDYSPNKQGAEEERSDTARRMKLLLNPGGVLCHPHFGDGDVPDLPGFTTVIVERLKVPPIRMADETSCEDVAIVFHQPEDFRTEA
ncbi:MULTISPECIES: class I SAM-dependent methyltransferase [unclassified Pseudomonas]|uniref:class I SAM-dependent methyltransferase n=1 Tax=unclassified Pseudomonas TaxID=196821 RepID=UPI001CBD2573|nr:MULTISPECIES: class I SAM-dependent methyltransferase [unclassified Pseudomonas]